MKRMREMVEGRSKSGEGGGASNPIYKLYQLFIKHFKLVFDIGWWCWK